MITRRDIGQPAAAQEVAAAFAAYESALVAGDTAILNEVFWDSGDTVRFGVADRQQGSAAIAGWRRSQGPLPGRQLSCTQLTTFGSDFAVITTLFFYPGRPLEGRQSQTWVRFSEGWRIVSAHVSEVASPARVNT